MRLLFGKSFMQPDDMVDLLRHRGLEIDLADNTLRKKIAARFGLTVPVFTSWITVVIDIVSPNNDMLEHLQALLAEYPMIDTRAMGFPQNWQDEPLWSTRC